MTTGRGEIDRSGRPQSPRMKQNELTYRLEQAIQYGVVEEVDFEKAKARVRIVADDGVNGRLSNWLPWSTGNADSGNGNWNPLQVGAQVAMLSPSGDAAQGSSFRGFTGMLTRRPRTTSTSTNKPTKMARLSPTTRTVQATTCLSRLVARSTYRVADRL